ncbi:MAG: hypothetical protein M3157_00140 [Actinomycetota bacterium]|nr:hypothetical protein [Actinomycetota bacterium]
MSRWIIIAGLATILISLVALASLSGGSAGPETEEEALQEPAPPEEPEAPEPAPAPTTTPQQETEPEEQTTREEQPTPGIQRDERQTPGPGPSVATVRITGDATYSCSVGRIDSPRRVRGANPTDYQVRVARGGTSLDTVMAVCQKITGDELSVGIIYDGEVRAQDDTTARFGTVNVSWSPMQE